MRKILVNAVTNFRLHVVWGISCLEEHRLASQEWLCSLELDT